jgi:ATP-dependent DNA ligase
MNLQTTYDDMIAVQSIKAERGRTRATQLADALQAKPELARIFNLLLNQQIVTGLAKAKLGKTLDYETATVIQTFDDYLINLETQSTGTDERVRQLQGFINRQDPQYRQFLIELASKSFKTGFAVSKYNAIVKELGLPVVPEFNVQLAENITKLTDKLVDDNFDLGHVYVTEKFDGVRAIAFIENGAVRFYTRDGRRLEQLVELETELAQMSLDKHVLDGELLVTETDDLKAEDAFRATMKIVGSKGVKTGLTYHVFDALTSPERFTASTSVVPYAERRAWLNANLTDLPEHVSLVPVIGEFDVHNMTDYYPVQQLASTIISMGGEGIMLNSADVPYDFKRTKNLLKVKQINENDGEIVDTFMGQGKYEGMLGGIVVRYKDTTVRVGSGFSDTERQTYGANPEQLIGRMATYIFTTESHNEAGETSVRFPRFKALRLDKTPKDASYDN